MSLESTHAWSEKGVSFRARYFSKLGLIFMAIVLTFSVGGVFAGLSYFLESASNIWTEGLPTLLISIVVTCLGIFALIKLVHIMRASINFDPIYDEILPNQTGYPFEVWYEQPFRQETENEYITVRFDTDILVLTGVLENRSGGFIYSLAPSLVKNGISEVAVPYEEIKNVILKGRRISFKIGGKSILRGRVLFYVSEMDGERMYREFKLHFPALPISVG